MEVIATDAEVARVRAAYIAAGPNNLERLADDRVARQRDALVRLADVWGKMDIDARAAVSLELARLVSPDLAVDPHDLDVGAAVYRAMIAGSEDRAVEPDLKATSLGTQILSKRKRGELEPGFREAVLEAGKVWMERDKANKWSPKNIHRDTDHYMTKGFDPGPMLAFVAFTVTRALPVDALRSAVNRKKVEWHDMLRAVHSQLRPGAKKPHKSDPA